MVRSLAFLSRLTMICALVVALIGSAWAHRADTSAMTDDLLAYVASGGSLADICGDGGPTNHTQTCDACRLVDTVSLARVCVAPDQDAYAQLLVQPTEGNQHAPSAASHEHAARAPPALT